MPRATNENELADFAHFDFKIGCHGYVSCAIGKRGSNQQSTIKYLPYGENLVKIGLVDSEIALLKGSLKKKEANASKTYSQ